MNVWRWFVRAFVARIGWVLAGLLLLWLGIGKSHAATDCSSYWRPSPTYSQDASRFTACPSGQVRQFRVQQGSADSGWQTSVSAAANAVATAAGRNTYLYFVTPATGTATGIEVTLHDMVPAGSGCGNIYNQTDTFETTQCAVVNCALPADTRQGWAVSGAPATACMSNCRVTLRDGTDFGLGGPVPKYYATTGANCSGEAAGTVETDPHKCEGGVCSDAVSKELTDNTTPREPGTNAETVATSGCVTTESGGVFCIATAPNDLRPDNGTPGTPATPDQTITVPPPLNGQTTGAGTTINYYNSTTVSNSTNLGGASTDGDGSDSTGECEPGDTECEGGGRGDGRVHGSGLGTAKTFGASAGAFYQSVASGPIGSAVSGIASGFPTGGTCPPFAFSAPIIGSVSTDVHCELWTTYVAPVLSLVFLAVWALIAVRIFMSA